MGTRATQPTFLKRFERLERQARLQRVRRKGHTESKTFIVGGTNQAITTSTFIPPMFVGIDHDGETPEWKRLTGFAGVLQSGTLTVEWWLNSTSLGTLSLSTTVALLDLDTPVDLAHGDIVRPEVTAASSAHGLAAAAFIVTAAR